MVTVVCTGNHGNSTPMFRIPWQLYSANVQDTMVTLNPCSGYHGNSTPMFRIPW